MTENKNNDFENLSNRIKQLRSELDDMYSYNTEMDEAKIALSHYLDRLIVEYMREAVPKKDK